VNTIPSMESLQLLKVLHATNSPIQNIDAFAGFKNLIDLDISNTPVDDLKPLGALDDLQKLNCAGTQIKKLDPLERLRKLEMVDCSNTRVTSLDALQSLPLKTLKCYNTKVSSREIENFKKNKPECNVVYYR
jgi:Leucine-rich repeat (LRR) protein